MAHWNESSLYAPDQKDKPTSPKSIGCRSDLIVSSAVEEPTTYARKKASKSVNLDFCNDDPIPILLATKSPRIVRKNPESAPDQLAGPRDLDFGVA